MFKIYQSFCRKFQSCSFITCCSRQICRQTHYFLQILLKRETQCILLCILFQILILTFQCNNFSIILFYRSTFKQMLNLLHLSLCQIDPHYQPVLVEIPYCFSSSTEIVLSSQNASICVNFVPTNNTRCSVFPRGVNVTAQLNVLQPYIAEGYFYEFEYGKTNRICIPCNDAICTLNSFWLASAVEVRVQSLISFTTVTCGRIQRVLGDVGSCTYAERDTHQEFETYVEYTQHQLCFNAAMNGQCPDINLATANFLNGTVTLVNIYNNVTKTYSNKTLDFKAPNTANQFVTFVPGAEPYLKMCFANTEDFLNILSKSVPKLATMELFLVVDGVIINLNAQTVRNIQPMSTPGHTSMEIYVQKDTIELYGFTNAQGITNNALINAISNPKWVGTLYIVSNDQVIEDTLVYYDRFSFLDDRSFFFTSQDNSNINNLTHALKNYTINDIYIEFNQYVLDQNNDVQYSYRYQVAENMKMSCWAGMTGTWVDNGVKINVTANDDLDDCQLLDNQTVVLRISKFVDNNKIDTVVYTQIEYNFSIENTEFTLTFNDKGIEKALNASIAIQIQVYNEDQTETLEDFALTNFISNANDDYLVFQEPLMISSLAMLGLSSIYFVFAHFWQRIKKSFNTKKDLKLKQIDKTMQDDTIE
ncbi:Conserved_hypothetical protein [Hexamita inflata]|uniref:Transmembrane protein n=1 Tax=Hexamita inflata TaxID=28002 RepID=A0AA86QQR4_9EUKA|nr:Conserved hypothetical protein [Hexamita inflata]